MQEYEVFLTKTYAIRIITKNRDSAKKYVEFFTGDIIDISNLEDQKKYEFEIKDIQCRVNDAFAVHEIV